MSRIQPARVTRRQALLTGGTLFAFPAVWAIAGRDDPAEGLHDSFPLQDPALVAEVVGKSHFDFDRVQALVTRQPELAKGAIDWGFGDWESALGAASHTGRRNIAELLIDHGAIPNLFTHAMLGHFDIVASTLEARPDLAPMRGPHGITLLRHARAGGEKSRGVVEYLQERGDANPEQRSLDMTDDELGRYAGVYSAGTVRMTLDLRRGALHAQGEGGAARRLTPILPHVFAPAGAEHVRLVFHEEDGRIAWFRVHDPDPSVPLVREGA